MRIIEFVVGALAVGWLILFAAVTLLSLGGNKWAQTVTHDPNDPYDQ